MCVWVCESEKSSRVQFKCDIIRERLYESKDAFAYVHIHAYHSPEEDIVLLNYRPHTDRYVCYCLRLVASHFNGFSFFPFYFGISLLVSKVLSTIYCHLLLLLLLLLLAYFHIVLFVLLCSLCSFSRILFLSAAAAVAATSNRKRNNYELNIYHMCTSCECVYQHKHTIIGHYITHSSEDTKCVCVTTIRTESHNCRAHTLCT